MTSVLVVDDNDSNRKLAVDVLHAAGFRTFGAVRAAQGIALAREHVPDVILMDLQLPDMNGVEATRNLSAHERTAGIPVVAMSASPLEGATTGWRKPASPGGSRSRSTRAGSRSRCADTRRATARAPRNTVLPPRLRPGGTVAPNTCPAYVGTRRRDPAV